MTKETKPWQRGITIDRLKALTGLFKPIYSPYCGGGFGQPKERDVATAITEGHWEQAGDDAAVIGHQLKVTGTNDDFTGQPHKTLAGDYWATYLGWSRPGAAVRLARSLCDRFPAVWFSLPEEHPDTPRLTATAGLQWAYTNINAGGDIRGIYVGGQAYVDRLAAVPLLPGADKPAILVLDGAFLSDEELAAIRLEGHNCDAAWANHYSSYNKGKSWTALALRGYKPEDPTFIIKPGEMSRKWKEENAELLPARADWTPLAKDFPATLSVIDRLGLSPDRVRFMRLGPGGGELTRHADITDRSAGTADGWITRLHIPIRTNLDVVFQSWDYRGRLVQMSWGAGALCYLDQRKPHTARNNGTKPRTHLVIDVAADAGLRDMICRAAGLPPDTTSKQAATAGFGLA